MYRVPAFDVTDPDEIHQLITTSGPAHLVTHGPDGFSASVLPMILRPDVGEHGALHGHLARPNPQWRQAVTEPVDAFAIFTGPDAYISPSWYASKREHGKVVPTWNYVTVNVHGRLVAHDDPTWVERIVRDLTVIHEGSRPDPWSVDDAPADFVTALLKGIVGVELEITRIEAKRKLSQNRPAADIEGAAAGLDDGDETERRLAALMRAQSATRPTTV